MGNHHGGRPVARHEPGHEPTKEAQPQAQAEAVDVRATRCHSCSPSAPVKVACFGGPGVGQTVLLRILGIINIIIITIEYH